MSTIWESRLNKAAVTCLCLCLALICGVATVELHSMLALLACCAAGAGGMCTAATIR